jgi:hypothetical protein
MKKKIGNLALSLVVAGAVQASGSVTWFSSGAAGPAAGSTDESSVSTNGTLTYAYNLGATDSLTANTVLFEGTDEGGLASIGGGNITFDPVDGGASADFNNLTSNLGTLLDSARWAPAAGETVTLNNLVPDQDYLIQLYSSDTRVNRDKNLLLDGTFDAGYTGAADDGTGRYAIGLFTADESGQASFFYAYAVGESGNANLNIIQVREISGEENFPPVASSQDVVTLPDTPVGITLSGLDPEGGSLTYTVDDTSLIGELTGTAPDLTYIPATDYSGTDSFTFIVNDGLDDSAPATVTVTVTNYLPTADSMGVTTPENTDVGITLSGSDPEGSSLTYSIVSQPVHGTITTNIALPSMTYHPDIDFVGTDSFTYTVSDGLDDSALATVSIEVLGADEMILYLDTFDGDGLAVNTGIGGGAGYVLMYKASWEDSGLGLQFDTTRNHSATRAIAYSLNTFPATNGFELTVNYNCSQVTDNSDNQFSFGLVRDDLDVSTYGTAGELNPFGVWTQTNLYSVGINVMADTGIVTNGLYSNTGTNAALLGAGTTVAGTDVTVVMHIEDNGAGGADVSWSVDDVDQGSATIDGFDFSKSYAFVTFASDQEIEPIINSVKLNAATELPLEPPVISAAMASGGLVMSWDGNASFDVLTNANLVYPNWGVAVENATSPVTNGVGSETQLFFKLSE